MLQSEKKVKHMRQKNFASLYGGAQAIAANPESENSRQALSDDQDKYMMNQCRVPEKFLVVMLKEDINIEGFSIINREFYSSNVKLMEVTESIELFIFKKKKI